MSVYVFVSCVFCRRSKKTGKFVSSVYFDEEVKRYRHRKTGRFIAKPSKEEIEKSDSDGSFVMVDEIDGDDDEVDDETGAKKDDEADDKKSPVRNTLHTVEDKKCFK